MEWQKKAEKISAKEIFFKNWNGVSKLSLDLL